MPVSEFSPCLYLLSFVYILLFLLFKAKAEEGNLAIRGGGGSGNSIAIAIAAVQQAHCQKLFEFDENAKTFKLRARARLCMNAPQAEVGIDRQTDRYVRKLTHTSYIRTDKLQGRERERQKS